MMSQNVLRFCLSGGQKRLPENSFALALCFLVSGCFYGPPPNYQPMPAQQQIMPTPAQSGTTFAPETQGATTLDDVQDAAANQVLTVPKPRDPGIIHEAKEGDTLSSIARQYGVTVDDLMTTNAFDREPVIQSGQLLRIPNK